MAGAALVVAVAAAWALVPRAPALDGERWFKVMLATLLRGQVERDGGDADAWERLVVRFVPYHPGGRHPERKVTDPEHYVLDGLSEPGELALLDALRRLPTAPERWARMYDTDEAALQARLVDPGELGESYDPATWLAASADWDALAAWGAGDAGFGETLRQRHDARWVLVRGTDEGRPDVLGALALVLGDRATVAEGPAAALAAAVPTAADRMVVVASGDAVQPTLQALVDEPFLRDRLSAFVAVGGRLAGDPALEDWVGHWFAHETLDTEINRRTPYLSVAWHDRAVEPPGVPGLPIGWQRFPAPRDTRTQPAVEVVDLGLLPADPALPVAQVARGLWAVVVCLSLARG